ncbi:MAG TPA: ABC transporter, partial [Clostridiales bacterium]|nr:ABC transporter [Clostridiales bacterium]
MIEIAGLTKRYGKKTVLDHISFTVNEGEVLGFLGPNGAGKSTTMNILAGYLSCNEGQAKISGIDILEHPIEAKKKIGYLPEIPPLYPELTVKEFLRFVFDLKGCKMNRNRHLAEIVAVTQLDDVYERAIHNLSKGFRQRVGIAQALVGNPQVLIFDEPTIGLDPKQIIEIRKLIKALGKDHTIILSSHILPEVQTVCDRVVILHEGKVVANEKTEELSKIVDIPKRLVVTIAGPKADVLKMLKNGQGILYAEFIGEREGGSNAFIVEAKPNLDIRA